RRCAGEYPAGGVRDSGPHSPPSVSPEVGNDPVFYLIDPLVRPLILLEAGYREPQVLKDNRALAAEKEIPCQHHADCPGIETDEIVVLRGSQEMLASLLDLSVVKSQ